LKTERCEVGYFIFGKDKDDDEIDYIKFQKPVELLNLNNNFYYFFKNEK